MIGAFGGSMIVTQRGHGLVGDVFLGVMWGSYFTPWRELTFRNAHHSKERP